MLRGVKLWGVMSHYSMTNCVGDGNPIHGGGDRLGVIADYTADRDSKAMSGGGVWVGSRGVTFHSVRRRLTSSDHIRPCVSLTDKMLWCTIESSVQGVFYLHRYFGECNV